MDEKTVKIQLRRGTEAEFTTNNPVLARGEPGVVIGGTSHGRIKIGDGNKTWSELPYSTSLPTEGGALRTVRIPVDISTYALPFIDNTGGRLQGAMDFMVLSENTVKFSFYFESQHSVEVGLYDVAFPVVICSDSDVWSIIYNSELEPFPGIRWNPNFSLVETVNSSDYSNVAVTHGKIMAINMQNETLGLQLYLLRSPNGISRMANRFVGSGTIVSSGGF